MQITQNETQREKTAEKDEQIISELQNSFKQPKVYVIGGSEEEEIEEWGQKKYKEIIAIIFPNVTIYVQIQEKLQTKEI